MPIDKYSSRAKFKHERIISPRKCDPNSFRVKKISPGVELTVCCPAGHYAKGRCQVGTIAQKMMKKK